MKWFFVVFAAALIVSVTWWNVGTRSSGGAVSPGVTDEQDAGLDQSLKYPNVAVRRPAPISASPEERVRNTQLRHEQGRMMVKKVVDTGRRKLLGRYDAEKVDAAWAAEREHSLVEHAVNPQIHDLGVEPKNLTAHCRSSTCQLTADFPTRSAADDWFTLYLTNTGTNLYNASYQSTANPDGTTHVEIYGLAKKP